MTFKDVLGFTVLGACVTTIGSLLAMYIKEFVAARWLERWKTEQTLLGVYRRYQMPIFLAAEELCNRLYGLSREDNDREMRAIGVAQLKTTANRTFSAAVSDHYFRYRFVSNVYRLCNFLGWLELYRRDIGTLDTDAIDHNRKLDVRVRAIRGVLADGWINQHADWKTWKDCLIYREEQRAIGSSMEIDAATLRTLDFGRFTTALERDPNGLGEAKWFVQTAYFFDNLTRERDFRLVRMKMLVVYLIELMELLQPGRIDRSHIKIAANYRAEFDRLTGGPVWFSKPLPDRAAAAHF